MPPVPEILPALSGQVEVSLQVSPPSVALVLLCLAISSFGSFCANCLAYYSPTKLQNRLPGEEGQRLVAHLEQREGEYRIRVTLHDVRSDERTAWEQAFTRVPLRPALVAAGLYRDADSKVPSPEIGRAHV